jgi:hypothetical protein
VRKATLTLEVIWDFDADGPALEFFQSLGIGFLLLEVAAMQRADI